MKGSTKKRLMVGVCVVACVVLAVLIGMWFVPAVVQDPPLPKPSVQPTEVVTPAPIIEPPKPVVTIPTPTPPTPSPGSTASGDASGTEQTIQPEVTKPPEPSEAVKTDPSQTPDGEKVTQPPVSVPHDEVVKPSAPPETPDQPQGGETNDNGQIYVPGFGWRTPSGGHGTTVDGDGDINKQVGIMD